MGLEKKEQYDLVQLQGGSIVEERILMHRFYLVPAVYCIFCITLGVVLAQIHWIIGFLGYVGGLFFLFMFFLGFKRIKTYRIFDSHGIFAFTLFRHFRKDWDMDELIYILEKNLKGGRAQR